MRPLQHEHGGYGAAHGRHRASRRASSLRIRTAADTPSKADGRFGKQDFVYLADENAYLCPAGQTLPWRMTNVENGLTLHRYWDLASCRACDLKARCTTSLNRRITRWEHEAVLDAMERRLDREPETMRTRRQNVEHVFGTIKAWMGSTHVLTRRIGNAATETSP